MYTDIELFRRVLGLKDEELQRKLLFWLEKQLIFRSIEYSQNTKGQEESITRLWNNTYFARHKWMSNVAASAARYSAIVEPTLLCKAYYLASYLDYDVKNEIKLFEEKQRAERKAACLGLDTITEL